jgi:hypothetical protein
MPAARAPRLAHRQAVARSLAPNGGAAAERNSECLEDGALWERVLRMHPKNVA